MFFGVPILLQNVKTHAEVINIAINKKYIKQRDDIIDLNYHEQQNIVIE